MDISELVNFVLRVEAGGWSSASPSFLLDVVTISVSMPV